MDCKECEKSFYFPKGKACKEEALRIVPIFRDLVFKRFIADIPEIAKWLNMSEECLMILVRGYDLSHDQIKFIDTHVYSFSNMLDSLKENLRDKFVQLSLVDKKALKKMRSALRISEKQFNHDFHVNTASNEHDLAKYYHYIDRIMPKIDDKKMVLANSDLETYI